MYKNSQGVLKKGVLNMPNSQGKVVDICYKVNCLILFSYNAIQLIVCLLSTWRRHGLCMSVYSYICQGYENFFMSNPCKLVNHCLDSDALMVMEFFNCSGTRILSVTFWGTTL